MEEEDDMGSVTEDVGLTGLRRAGLLIFMAASAALFVGAFLAALLD